MLNLEQVLRLTALSNVLGFRLALAGALLACSCQRDASALFDDGQLPGPGVGGSSSSMAGSLATAGDSAGGEEASGGAGDVAGSAAGGTMPTAGMGASSGAGGSDRGGTPGSAGEGGASGSGTAGGGTGGTKPQPEPEPVNILIDQFEDAYVASCYPNASFGNAETLNVDGDSYCTYHALLAPSLATLPDGAVVSEATLTLTCANAGGAIEVSYVDEAWMEDSVRWGNRPEVGNAIGSLTCTDDDGAVTLDLTTVVQVWASGQHSAYGIYLRSEDGDGTDFVSSEGDSSQRRPQLSITYTLPQK